MDGALLFLRRFHFNSSNTIMFKKKTIVSVDSEGSACMYIPYDCPSQLVIDPCCVHTVTMIYLGLPIVTSMARVRVFVFPIGSIPDILIRDRLFNLYLKVFVCVWGGGTRVGVRVEKDFLS